MLGTSRIPWLRPLLFSLAFCARASAQCPDWKPGFHVNGIDGQVLSLCSFDDGTGPALYAGGRFRSSGGVETQNISRWNGSTWSALGSGIQAPIGGGVYAMAVFDDGTGPALFAAGDFTQAGGASAVRIAKWNGSSWSPLGVGIDGYVYTLAVFDDGSGPALFVGGAFSSAGGLPTPNIAKWDGSNWSLLGFGLDDVDQAFVSTLAVYDDGTGSALYAGGKFNSAGGAPASDVAKWDGAAWSPLGSGTNAPVRALTTFDDGTGLKLYAAGQFVTAGGISVPQMATWDGSNWAPFGVGFTGGMFDLIAFDDGSGPHLYAAGNFGAGSLGARDVARWNGSDWEPLATGIPSEVDVLAVHDDGTGPALVAGGQFRRAGGLPANQVASWKNAAWSALGDGSGVDSTVLSLLPFDDGSGPKLIAGGGFGAAGNGIQNGIAAWDGSSWASLGTGLDHAAPSPALVDALAAFDDGGGRALYAAGYFTSAGGVPVVHIAKWDGHAWSALGSGLGDPTASIVYSLAVFDDGSGPALYAGGRFATAGGIPAANVAKWDGAAWSALGSGAGDAVYALAVFDDGGGPALYAGGTFNSAGGVAASRIARWDGSAWSPVGGGTNHHVLSLAVFDDGGGPALYAGGYFTSAGGTQAQHVARWNGSNWSRLGSGVAGAYCQVDALCGFDDGSGPALWVGGVMSTAGGQPASAIARWDGAHWSSPGVGMSAGPGQMAHVDALVPYDDGVGRSLYVGGLFSRSGDVYANFLGAWSACPGLGAGTPFCFGDGSAGVCPCSNVGQTGHGCENSASTGGALLGGSGNSSLAGDSVVLASSGELPSALSVFLQGDAALAAPAIFGDGLRCAGGHLKRLYVKNAAGGQAVAPQGAELHVSARSAALGDPILAGETRTYQVYYRDPSAAFCPPPTGGTFNVTQALRIFWTP